MSGPNNSDFVSPTISHPLEVLATHRSENSISPVESFDDENELREYAPERVTENDVRPRSNSVKTFLTRQLSHTDTVEQNNEVSGYHGVDIMGTIQLTKTLGGRDNEETEEAIEKMADKIKTAEVPHDVEEDKEEEEAPEVIKPLTRTQTMLDNIKRNFWDKEFREERAKQLGRLALLHIFIVMLLLAAISIYSGSYYGRSGRYNDLKFYLINEDDSVGQLPGLIGSAGETIAKGIKTKGYGNWESVNITQFKLQAQSHNNTISEEIERVVHHQKCWGAAHIPANATFNYYEALLTGNTNYNISNSSVVIYYESARDYMAVTLTMKSLLYAFESAFLTNIPLMFQDQLVSKVLNSSQITNIARSNNSMKVLTMSPRVSYIDTIPITSTVVLPALQLGMVYILMFSFFGFLTSIKIHVYVSKQVQGVKYLLYRFITTQFTYFILGLSYASLCAIFKAPYDATFGQAGFLVIWFVTYLATNAVGTINECAALICFTTFPPIIGPWILIWTVLNIAPTFSIIPLCPVFYRYGYGVPIHNLYEVLKVCLCNSWKGHLGRNIGVLIIWAFIGNVSLPIVQTYVAKKMKNKALAAAAAAENKDKNS